MIEGLSLATLFAAFAAGLISVLSPCVMPLMPAYLSLISGVSVEELGGDAEDRAELRRRVMRGCTGFVAGFSTVFVLLGASATSLGRVLRTFELELFGLSISAVQIAGVVILLMGLHLMGWLPISALYRDTPLPERLAPRLARHLPGGCGLRLRLVALCRPHPRRHPHHRGLPRDGG